MAQPAVTIVQQPPPKDARVGAFLGAVLHVYVQPTNAAATFLQAAHRHQGPEAMPLSSPPGRAKHDGRTRPVVRAWPDRSCVLGRMQRDGSTHWHPTPLVLPQEVQGIPGLHTTRVDARRIALDVDGKGRVLATEGPAFLIDAWRRSWPGIVALWDQTWGDPPAVHDPRHRDTGLFSPVAPFVAPQSDALQKIHDLLALAITAWSQGPTANLRWTPGHVTGNGTPKAPTINGFLHNPDAPVLPWITALGQAGLWPLTGSRAYIRSGEGHPPSSVEATLDSAPSAHARLQALATIHRMLPQGWGQAPTEETRP